MNAEERARKWTQNIPELQDLSIQQRMIICSKVARKLIVILSLWGLLVLAAYFVVLTKADQNSVIYNMLNNSALTVPMVVLSKICRKPMLISAARSL